MNPVNRMVIHLMVEIATDTETSLLEDTATVLEQNLYSYSSLIYTFDKLFFSFPLVVKRRS